MTNILTTTKKMLGIDSTYVAFDIDILLHINMVFSILFQLGVFDEAIRVGQTTTWNSLDLDDDLLGLIQDYVFLKVKLSFDPPTASGALLESLKEQIKELEWRISVSVNTGDDENE